MYLDIETREYVTTQQLRKEYLKLRQEEPWNVPESFMQYILNCLVKNNGTLVYVR